VTGVIYHLVPIDYWEAQPADRPYAPADYEREGFIHCTRGEEQVAVVANRYYQSDPREWLVLILDEQAITSEVKYEPGRDGLFYPHIYGLLNRDAIREVQHMLRDPDGTFRSMSRS
jgi:uncharacterized protein (DUF952 family)